LRLHQFRESGEGMGKTILLKNSCGRGVTLILLHLLRIVTVKRGTNFLKLDVRKSPESIKERGRMKGRSHSARKEKGEGRVFSRLKAEPVPLLKCPEKMGERKRGTSNKKKEEGTFLLRYIKKR